MVSLLRIASLLIEDALRWVLLLFRSAEALRAQNPFLRMQLALYIERGVPPRRIDPASRVSLAYWQGSSIGAARWWSCSRRRWFAGIAPAGDCSGE
jgi:hypothetical protein